VCIEFRGFVVRRQHSVDRRRHMAAVMVQSVVRGYLQRLAYQRLLAEHRRKMILLTTGTTRLNSAYNPMHGYFSVEYITQIVYH